MLFTKTTTIAALTVSLMASIPALAQESGEGALEDTLNVLRGIGAAGAFVDRALDPDGSLTGIIVADQDARIIDFYNSDSYTSMNGLDINGSTVGGVYLNQDVDVTDLYASDSYLIGNQVEIDNSTVPVAVVTQDLDVVNASLVRSGLQVNQVRVR